ncbi:MAG TPA: S8 family serine peptidase [Longimicrobiaceae bacterium]|nr:S8 family serine peptidase [Longimicrobiaceae bacterium]
MTRSLRPLAALALAGAALLSACSDRNPAGAAAPAARPALDRGGRDVHTPFAEGQLIVRFRDGAQAEEVSGRHRGQVKRSMRLARTFVLDVAPGEELALADSFAADPDVEFAEPDYMFAVSPCETGTCETPTDPFIGYKWDLMNDGAIRTNTGAVLGATGKVDADIDWEETYDYLGKDFAGTAVVGIIDTGVRKTHQDLAGRVIAERNFATGYAADFTDDRNGHGTHVAGIAAARAGNGLGLSGVAYGANIKIINAKSCELYRFPDGSVSTSCPASSTADAIVWAVDQGANVLNMSLGGSPLATSGSAAQLAALRYARSRNVLPFCSTGNDNYGAVSFPGRFEECISVGATNWSDARASYSNYGPEIDLVAPGGDSNPTGSSYSLILSSVYSTTTPTSNTTYGWKAGTSMASPQAAGLAALLFATGMTNAEEVLARIRSTVDDLGPAGWDPHFGAGRINAYRAVTGTDPDAPPVAVVGGPYAASEGSPVQFSSAGSADPNGKPVTYAWSFGDGTTSTEANPAHVFVDNGSYAVTLTVTDQSGLARSVSSTAAIGNAAPAVTAALGAASIPSGGTASLAGAFSDAGLADAPWTYSIAWGNGTTGGMLNAQSQQVAETRRFCAAGSYTVRLSVTDKDGGTGSAAAVLTVGRNPVSIVAPDAINEGPTGAALVPVTVFSRAGFDAASVVATGATLGNGVGAETPLARRNNGAPYADLTDVDRDGRADLVLQFERARMIANGDVNSATTKLVLQAGLKDGCLQVQGAAPVKVVP